MCCREKSPSISVDISQKRKSDKKEKDDLAKSKDVQFLIQVSIIFSNECADPWIHLLLLRSKTIKNLEEK